MRKNLFKIFALLMVLAMVVAPASAQTKGDGPVNPQGSRTMEELPQEVIDTFADGMSIEEFLLNNKGPIPNALKEYANQTMVVIVQMEQPSLVEYMAAQGKDVQSMRAMDQKSYVNTLSQSQKAVAGKVAELGGVVMGQFTKAYNGLLVKVTYPQLQTLREMNGVKNIYRAPEHTVNLTASVPLINADDVWTDPGYTGEGVTIAVIDTGIDYTHAMLEGVGTAAAYAANDPDVVEPGSFPTMKVIGGYDFAGTNYDARDDASVPMPDFDPLDENGHGTHVASTAAGFDFDDTDALGSGVAPDAKLYALKVFGAEGSTNLVLPAIEWAMDPDGDGDVSDHVDVINMSLGSDFGPNDTSDPELIAVNNAAAIGIFIATSAGNAGDSSYITGGPSVADASLSTAASTTGFATFPVIAYNDGSDQQIPYQPSDNPFLTATTGLLADVDALDGTDEGAIGELCDTAGLDSADFTGKIALVQRGTCGFEDKINNADSLGAIAVIVYNDEARGDDYVSMGVGTATLPAGFIYHSNGLILAALDDAIEVTIGPDTDVKVVPSGDPDVIADFSSRGPRGFDSVLKPEITAPGVAIYAAQVGSGDEGVSYNGTSMAAPHIAGVAALMKEAHPTWSVEEIKAAMMNTAVDLDWSGGVADVKATMVDVPRQGAGRVDAYASVTTDVVVIGDENLVSLNWGVVDIEADTFVDIKTITLKNFSNSSKTYSASFPFTNGDSTGATLELVTPGNIIVPANGSVAVPVKLSLDMTQMPINFGSDELGDPYPLEEYFGFVVFSEVIVPPDEGVYDLGPTDLRIPFYFSPRPYSKLTQISKSTSFDAFSGMAHIGLTQTGSASANLWAFPAVLVDPNESAQEDHADLRYVGLDYGWYSATRGDIITAAFAMYGPLHTNQPYFSYINFYIDADQDGLPETRNYNFNVGAYYGGDDDNIWIVAQKDYVDGETYLGSPYLIWADYNSGIQEWYLPAGYNYLSETNSTFDYYVYSYDWYGNEDDAGSGRFDYMKPPFSWDIVDVVPDTNLTPAGELVDLQVEIYDLGGYNYSQPKGVMLFDYNGRPGMGQSYYWPLEVTGIPTVYLPVISK